MGPKRFSSGSAKPLTKPPPKKKKKEESFPEATRNTIPAAAHSSLKDLVVYNERGQATIDINQLIYKPKITKQLENSKDIKTSSYLPDYVFVIINFLGLTFSTYYFINGLTIVSWKNTMQMFTADDCDEPRIENVEICETIKANYPEKDPKTYPILRFYGFDNPAVHGALLLVVGILDFVNIVTGINACIDGSYRFMITHLILDGFLIVLEVILVTVIGVSGRCEYKDMDIIASFILRRVNNYAGPYDELYKQDTMEMDAIQLALTCCGVGNWTDFMPLSNWYENGTLNQAVDLARYNLDNSDMVIPSSCCRQWWIRNLYCAYEAHLWAYPTITALEAHRFRQRISQLGCLPRMVGLCSNMIRMGGTGGAVAWGIHVLLSIIRQYVGITLLERGSDRDAQKKAKKPDILASDEDDDAAAGQNGSGHKDDDDDLPDMPRENDIAYIKSRRNFNIVRSAMRDTHMESWMENGRKFVEGNDAGRRRGNSWGEGNFKNELRNRGKPTRQSAEGDVRKSLNKNKDEDERNAANVVKMINNMANY